MNKKILWIPVAAALTLSVLSGCGWLKQQTDPQGTNATEGADASITETVGQGNATAPTVQLGDSGLVAGEGVEDWDNNTGNQTTAGNAQTSSTQPSQSTQPSDGSGQEDMLAYEIYLSWSTAKQQEFFKSFADPDKFYEWLEAAEAEYEKKQEGNVIEGGGSLDLKDLIEKFGKEN